MRPLLFIDFDGTICHDRFWRSIEPSKQSALQQFLFVEREELIADWMRGKHSSEDINTLLAERIEVPYDLLWEVFEADCQTMHVPKDILEKIILLRDTFTTILATDNMDCFSRFTVPALHLHDYFDDIVNSAGIGMCKKDAAGKFFTDVAQKHGLPITQSVLIDNSPTSCQTMINLGGKGCLVTPLYSTNYWLDHYMAAREFFSCRKSDTSST
jgi:FMN phosphatase YigB (HAD superfamily)